MSFEPIRIIRMYTNEVEGLRGLDWSAAGEVCTSKLMSRDEAKDFKKILLQTIQGVPFKVCKSTIDPTRFQVVTQQCSKFLKAVQNNLGWYEHKEEKKVNVKISTSSNVLEKVASRKADDLNDTISVITTFTDSIKGLEGLSWSTAPSRGVVSGMEHCISKPMKENDAETCKIQLLKEIEGHFFIESQISDPKRFRVVITEPREVAESIKKIRQGLYKETPFKIITKFTDSIKELRGISWSDICKNQFINYCISATMSTNDALRYAEQFFKITGEELFVSYDYFDQTKTTACLSIKDVRKVVESIQKILKNRKVLS